MPVYGTIPWRMGVGKRCFAYVGNFGGGDFRGTDERAGGL